MIHDVTQIIDLVPGILAARLNADPFFKYCPIVVLETGNVAMEAAVKQAVITAKNGKRGACVVVPQLIVDDESDNLQFGPMTLKPACQVFEQVELNNDSLGSRISARRYARRIRDVLKGFGHGDVITSLRCDKPAIIPIPQTPTTPKNLVGYEIGFSCFEKSAADMRQVQAPQITQAGNTPFAQISCPTPLAEVFYTLDDSYPTSDQTANPNSIVYTGPLPIPPTGLTICACAYILNDPAWIASHVNRTTIEIN